MNGIIADLKFAAAVTACVAVFITAIAVLLWAATLGVRMGWPFAAGAGCIILFLIAFAAARLERM